MKRALTLIRLVLATAAVYMGVHLFYSLVEVRFDRMPVVDADAPESEAGAAKPVPALSAYKSISRRNLFKIREESETVSEKPVAIDQLKQTELKLKLWGTVIDDDGKAYAVIEDSAKREQNLYLAGDAIQNASVKMILREKVILYVDGKDEILSMEKMDGVASGGGARLPAPALRPGPPAAITQKIVLNKEQLADALQDVNELMKQARFRPHFQDGKPDGLLLTGIRPTSIFRKMGLRNGDILMGVNEEDIGTLDDAVKLYQDLASTDSAKIRIKRRGRLQTMEYTLR